MLFSQVPHAAPSHFKGNPHELYRPSLRHDAIKFHVAPDLGRASRWLKVKISPFYMRRCGAITHEHGFGRM